MSNEEIVVMVQVVKKLGSLYECLLAKQTGATKLIAASLVLGHFENIANKVLFDLVPQ